MRVDDGIKGSIILAITMKARAVVGRGEKRLLGDPEPELRRSRQGEEEKESAKPFPHQSYDYRIHII